MTILTPIIAAIISSMATMLLLSILQAAKDRKAFRVCDRCKRYFDSLGNCTFPEPDSLLVYESGDLCLSCRNALLSPDPANSPNPTAFSDIKGTKSNRSSVSFNQSASNQGK